MQRHVHEYFAQCMSPQSLLNLSDPYTKLKDVSPFVSLRVVLIAHGKLLNPSVQFTFDFFLSFATITLLIGTTYSFF